MFGRNARIAAVLLLGLPAAAPAQGPAPSAASSRALQKKEPKPPPTPATPTKRAGLGFQAVPGPEPNKDPNVLRFLKSAQDGGEDNLSLPKKFSDGRFQGLNSKPDLERLQNQLQDLKNATKKLEEARTARPPMPVDPDVPSKEELARKRAEWLQQLQKQALAEEKAKAAVKKQLPLAKRAVEGPLDPLGLACALFKDGKYDDALVAFRMVEQSNLKPEERLLIQYLTACCEKEKKNFEEATVLYKQVSASKTDRELSENADWQERGIHWRQGFDDHLNDLQRRLQALESPKP